MTRSPAIYMGKDNEGNVNFISLWHIVNGKWINIIQKFDLETGHIEYYTNGNRESHYSSRVAKGN